MIYWRIDSKQKTRHRPNMIGVGCQRDRAAANEVRLFWLIDFISITSLDCCKIIVSIQVEPKLAQVDKQQQIVIENGI